MTEQVLQVENFTMHYKTRKGDVSAVEDVSFTLARGEALGLVGESGCGKTSVAVALLRLLPDNARILSGSVKLNGANMLTLSDDEVRRRRWKEIAMVFQAAMNSLNPVYTVKEQIVEAMQHHIPELTSQEMDTRTDELFTLVGLDPVLQSQYPHQYSGGMRQRAVVALALACNPDIIIADEPTTALDVIVQDGVLKRLREIQRRLNMAMIYISHDIAVIAEVSDRVAVMYAGRMVEIGRTEDIFHNPRHPYTAALMQSFPSVSGEKHELVTLPGEPPDLLHPPEGCRFHPRCPNRVARCDRDVPVLLECGQQQQVACWNPVEVQE